MVSALTSTRLVSAQLALTTLLSDDSSDDSSSSSSSSSSLASSLLSDSSTGSVSSVTSQSQTMLASLLGSMTGSSLSSSEDTSTDATTSSSSTNSSTDITSSSFMALLKQDLTTTAEGSGDGAKQAQAMLTALAAGTLTVSDPINGVSITAWDPSSSDSSTGSDSSASSHMATSIATSGWNDYLKEHLERNSDATFTRTADNSFVDKSTGNEAYFGQVGSQYYYLSWPASGTSSSGTTSGTPATASTSN